MSDPPRADPTGDAQRRFEAAARLAGLDPFDRWVGGYADYEWYHLRPALIAYGIVVKDRDVLEFGSNVGGSSVVLADMGARLSGVDVDPALPPVAQANLARHDLAGNMQSYSGGRLPFDDATFDLAIANSVLEYVDRARLDAVLAELHRVLRPGGAMFVCGTASRLALRERHSNRWFVNWLPRIFGPSLQRGLSPALLRRCVTGRFHVEDNGAMWLEARRAIHGRVGMGARLYALLGRIIGVTPGWFAPYIELLLRRI